MCVIYKGLYSMFKKSLLAVVTSALFSVIAFNASADDQGHGIVTFSGTVITAPCSVDEDSTQIDVDLGQVADTVLNGGKYSDWIGPYISRHFLSLNPLLVRRRRYSRGERYPSALCGCHSL